MNKCRFCEKLYSRRGYSLCKHLVNGEIEDYSNESLNVDDSCCEAKYFELCKEIESLTKTE